MLTPNSSDRIIQGMHNLLKSEETRPSKTSCCSRIVFATRTTASIVLFLGIQFSFTCGGAFTEWTDRRLFFLRPQPSTCVPEFVGPGKT